MFREAEIFLGMDGVLVARADAETLKTELQLSTFCKFLSGWTSLSQGPQAAPFTCRRDQLHNLQYHVQNENAGPPVKKVKNFKTAAAGQQTKCMALLRAESCAAALVACLRGQPRLMS